MPSLERLKQRMAGKPFVILAVDMAESDAQIQAFLKQMNTPKIDFTILKDPNGKALKAWKVFVFPTSFVLDTKGHLRYSLLGSTEWDAPNTVKQIETLLPKPKP
jgi:thiol-disulfide isomerase/thioredoxin